MEIHANPEAQGGLIFTIGSSTEPAHVRTEAPVEIGFGLISENLDPSWEPIFTNLGDQPMTIAIPAGTGIYARRVLSKAILPPFVPLPFLGEPAPVRITTGIGLLLQARNETSSPPFCQARLDLGHVRLVRQGDTVIDDYYAAQIHCTKEEGHEGPHGTGSAIYRGVEADVTSHRFDLSWEREPLARPEDDGPRQAGDVKVTTSKLDQI